MDLARLEAHAIGMLSKVTASKASLSNLTSTSEDIGARRRRAAVAKLLQRDILEQLGQARAEFAQLLDSTMAEVRTTVEMVGNKEIMVVIDSCATAAAEASAFAEWFYKSTNVSGLGEGSPESIADATAAIHTAAAGLKQKEDNLASELHGAFLRFSTILSAESADAEEEPVPESRSGHSAVSAAVALGWSPLEDNVGKVVERAAGLAWALHSAARELTVVVKQATAAATHA